MKISHFHSHIRKTTILGAVLILALAGSLFAAPPVTPASPALKEWIETRLRLVSQKPGERQSRDLTQTAAVVLMTGGDAAVAENLLRRAYETQVMNPDDRAYGQLRWLVGDTEPIKDFNAIEFNSIWLGCILLDYEDQLSADFKTWLQPHLQASLIALHTHQPPVTYTNICVMNAICLMLVGQASGNVAAIQEGQRRLDAWAAYTQANGVHEFTSPVYSAVDVSVLVKGVKYVADPVYRNKCKVLLDYLWTDIAANYFAPRGQLAGPNSRDYEFLTGNGFMDDWLGAVGWSTYTPSAIIAEIENYHGTIYQPPATAKALAQSGPRTVITSWDESAAHQRYVWIGNSISIGTTSGSYGWQDKLFSVLFASKAWPHIYLAVDTFDSPYGKVKHVDGARHPKSFHEIANLASVQHGPIALLTTDVNPSKVLAEARSLATNFVLPAEATFAINGKPVLLNKWDQIPVPPESVLTVSAEGATVAFRLLFADSQEARTPELFLRADEDGLKFKAARLELRHLPAGAHSAAQHLRTAWLVAAAEGQDHAAAGLKRAQEIHFQQRNDRDHWDVKLDVTGLVLEISRSTKDPLDIRAQRINGERVKRFILSVNGQEVGAPIWRSLE